MLFEKFVLTEILVDFNSESDPPCQKVLGARWYLNVDRSSHCTVLS